MARSAGCMPARRSGWRSCRGVSRSRSRRSWRSPAERPIALTRGRAMAGGGLGERVLLNARVLTMDPERPEAEAVVLAGERIAFVGGNAEARAYAHAGARELDLAGQTVVPGFIESHNHMLGFGLTLAQVDAGYPAVRSIEQLKGALAERAAGTTPGQWVRARG